MKIVMQHGHTIDREDINNFLKTIPSSWSKAFDSIVVYSSIKELFTISFHPKERILGVHISEKYLGSPIEVIEEIAVASQVIQELGHLPRKLSKQKRSHYIQQWREIRS